ncbi:MAG: hypothetical protein ACKPKO_15665, partial [Candidatus Fonsibacter sp.]
MQENPSFHNLHPEGESFAPLDDNSRKVFLGPSGQKSGLGWRARSLFQHITCCPLCLGCLCPAREGEKHSPGSHVDWQVNFVNVTVLQHIHVYFNIVEGTVSSHETSSALLFR